MKVNGRCHCGEIQYEAEPIRTDDYLHCTDCQTMSGAPYRVERAGGWLADDWRTSTLREDRWEWRSCGDDVLWYVRDGAVLLQG